MQDAYWLLIDHMLESASRGVSASGGSASWGVSPSQGGVCSQGDLLPGGLLLGDVVSQHALRQTPPMNRMTDRCKNISLATTSLRPVEIYRLHQGLNPGCLFRSQSNHKNAFCAAVRLESYSCMGDPAQFV